MSFARIAVLTLLIAAAPTVAAPKEATPSEALMSGEAWAQFCDRMKRVGETILSDDFPGSAQDRAEGFRHLARTLGMALQWEIDFADPDFPAFYRHDDDVTKWGGPNVDNTYIRARIRGDATYKLSGDISTIHDLIVATRNGDMHLGKTGVAGDFDSSQLQVDEEGRFELLVGPDVDPKTGIRTPPDTEQLSIRQYYTDWGSQSPGSFHVERVSEGPLYPADLTPAEMARRLDAAARWVEASIPMWNDFMKRSTADTAVNTLSAPRSVPGGSSDIAYGGGHFSLEDDQALLIEMAAPDARYWSIQWYTFGWFESPDFANRQTSLNNAQARSDSDGMLRIVLSGSDPGVQNWIDTAGHRSGQISYRWIWTKTRPTPMARVVPLAEVRKHLPKETPVFGPEDRREQIEVRRTHIERRFRR
ncbi:MAG: DUF1214 domain-containing protein [Myxococcales bacterium]|nr:DUF1214 domain-containing protein [Myxococcales bacterium]